MNQWPTSGRMVHIDVGGFKCVPAIILDTYDPMDQPVERIRVQAFPINEFPHPLYLDNSEGHMVWHWPEFVGPVLVVPANPSLMGSTVPK